MQLGIYRRTRHLDAQTTTGIDPCIEPAPAFSKNGLGLRPTTGQINNRIDAVVQHLSALHRQPVGDALACGLGLGRAQPQRGQRASVKCGSGIRSGTGP